MIATTLSAIPQRLYAISAAQAESIPGEFIVGFKKEFHIPEAGKQLAISKGANILKQLTHPALNAILVRVPLQQADAFQEAMKESPLVRYVEANGIVRATIVPNDPNYVYQWSLPKIQAPQAWDISTGSSSVRVGVIDTGIDYNHQDIAPNYASCGYDWVNNDNDPMDDYGHGTHVAGIIAASTNNGIGVAGVAGGWGTTHGVTLIAEKVLNFNGRGSVADVVSGITHAVDTCGVRVINLSLGGGGYSNTFQSALQYAADHGVISVAAAGNNSGDASTFYPCAYGPGHPMSTAELVMCVSATDSSDNFATSFSNFGNPVDISAPGVSILSTFPGNSYAYLSGTSMATPHVAAVVALVMSQFPSYTRDQIWYSVLSGADDLGGTGWDAYYGWGRLNARQALYRLSFYTNPTSFVGASSSGSTSACSGTFTNGQSSTACGSSFLATANLPSPSSDWQFGHWEWSGGVSCSSNTANPTSCTMSSSGSLKALYSAKVTFYTNPSTVGSISWGSCSNPGQANGQNIFDSSLPPEFASSITACYVPSGYTFDSWSCSGGLACSASRNPTVVTFTGPGAITLNLKTGSLSNPVSSSLTASASPANPVHGTSFTVSGTLTANGVGLGGEQVLLVFGNGNVVAVTTQPDGSFTYMATAPVQAGVFDVEVFFLGDYGGGTQYLPSTATVTVSVS